MISCSSISRHANTKPFRSSNHFSLVTPAHTAFSPCHTLNTANIDWSGIRAAAVVIGIRAAARQAAAGLPIDAVKRFEDRVRQRALREHWSAPVANPVARINREGKDALNGLSPNVATGSVALQNTLAQLGEATRTNLAKAHHKAAKHAATLPAKELMSKDKATALRLHGQGAGLVHQWEAKQQQTNVMVNVALLGIDPGEVQATARVIEDGE